MLQLDMFTDEENLGLSIMNDEEEDEDEIT